MTAHHRSGMAAACLLIALLSAAAATLGVFARGSGEFITVVSARGETYEMATTGVYAFNAQRVVAEGVGWDIVTLLLAVPALILVVPLVARGSFRGRLFAAGLLGYFVYMYLEYAVTWAFGPLFLLFVANLGFGIATLAWLGWSLATDRSAERFGDGFPRRGWAVLNLAMSGLLAMMWLQRIAVALGREPVELLGETTFTVQALDLGLMVPTSLLTAVLVLRRTQIGYHLAAAFGVTFATMTAAITGMMLSAWAMEGTPQIVPIGIFGMATVLAVMLLARTYRGPRVRIGHVPDARAPQPAAIA
jgi:hypothetical protein